MNNQRYDRWMPNFMYWKEKIVEKTLKAMLGKTDIAYGAWLSLPDTITAEIAAHIGFDYLCIDMQHGSLDYQTTLTMLQAIDLGNSVPVVRVPINEASIIGKVLDVGAMAIIVPMVNNADEAQAAVSACHYPPLGKRSMGPKRPMTIPAKDYVRQAIQEISVIPMIETADGVKNIDEIVKLPGVDAVYVGPNDLQLSLGLEPGYDSDHPIFNDALKRIVEGCRNAGIAPGIHASAQLAAKRREQGFKIITVASDFGILKAGLQISLETGKQ